MDEERKHSFSWCLFGRYIAWLAVASVVLYIGLAVFAPSMHLAERIAAIAISLPFLLIAIRPIHLGR